MQEKHAPELEQHDRLRAKSSLAKLQLRTFKILLLLAVPSLTSMSLQPYHLPGSNNITKKRAHIRNALLIVMQGLHFPK